jgi:hypothetical protein
MKLVWKTVNKVSNNHLFGQTPQLIVVFVQNKGNDSRFNGFIAVP